MPPQPPITCQVCNESAFKYTCAGCGIVYCSVPCYKLHTQSNCKSSPDRPRNIFKTQIGLEPDREAPTVSAEAERSTDPAKQDSGMNPPRRLRTLASLRWPNVAPSPAIVDPLTINDPKPLQIPDYEAIAMSPSIRSLLNENPSLPTMLNSLDTLQGVERKRAIEAILGVDHRSTRDPSSSAFRWLPKQADEDDLALLRTFMDRLGKTIASQVTRKEHEEQPTTLEIFE